MKKLIILFLATSTLFSTSYLFKQIDTQDSSKNVHEDEVIISDHLSEEKSVIFFKPESKMVYKDSDGFLFNLEEKLNIIHGELYHEKRREIEENRRTEKAAATALIEKEEENKRITASNTNNIVKAIAEKKASSLAVKKVVENPTAQTSTSTTEPVKTNTQGSEPDSSESNATETPDPKPEVTKSEPPLAKEPVPQKEEPTPINIPAQEQKSFNYLSQVEKEILNVTNRHRRENGLNSLVWDETLYQSSRSHSRLMFESNNFVHTTKYKVAENIYMLASSDTSKYTAEFIVTKWMNSPGHRANILDSRITKMGSGVLTGNQYFAKYDRELPTLYATQHFK